MKRIASVIGLAPEHRAEYEELHANAWPGVLDRITRSNIRNYSIYRHGDLLFSYFEYVGDDFDADMQAMADDEETQRWWAICKPMQRPVDDRAEGEWWKDLPEVFHHD
ncbi:MAG: L-rhamnose mutarotase [Microcella sp.]|jgi:L-rhamnose mutarotase